MLCEDWICKNIKMKFIWLEQGQRCVVDGTNILLTGPSVLWGTSLNVRALMRRVRNHWSASYIQVLSCIGCLLTWESLISHESSGWQHLPVSSYFSSYVLLQSLVWALGSGRIYKGYSPSSLEFTVYYRKPPFKRYLKIINWL